MKSESEPFEEPFQDPDAQNKESMYFGSVIHLYRTRRNLSQADLADRLYVDRNSVANWEGGRSRPPLDVIPRLCDILSVPMDTFFNMPRHERDLSLEEQDAIALYHRLNPHDREVIHAMIASLQEFQQQRLKRRCLTGFVTLWRINLRAGLFPEQSLEKTGKPVFVKIGRFGPVVQIGAADDKEKPRFAQLPTDKSMETVTLEDALGQFQLPRTVGQFEEKDVVIGVGRFGPYIMHDKKFVSLPKGSDPMTITLDESVALIQEKRQQEEKRHLKSFAEDPKLEVLNGRYGPYIAYDGKNYRLPKNLHARAAELSYDEAMKIVTK